MKHPHKLRVYRYFKLLYFIDILTSMPQVNLTTFVEYIYTVILSEIRLVIRKLSSVIYGMDQSSIEVLYIN